MSIERKTKLTLAGLSLAGVTSLAIASTLKGQEELATAVSTEVVNLANGATFHKEAFDTETATTSAMAISETLENMGADFGDAREATEAACLVAKLNGADVSAGLTAYSEGVIHNDPAKFALGQRECERAAASLMLAAYEFPNSRA